MTSLLVITVFVSSELLSERVAKIAEINCVDKLLVPLFKSLCLVTSFASIIFNKVRMTSVAYFLSSSNK